MRSSQPTKSEQLSSLRSRACNLPRVCQRRSDLAWLTDTRGSQPHYGMAAHLVLLWAVYDVPAYILLPAAIFVVGMRIVWLLQDPHRIGRGLELISICVGGIVTGMVGIGTAFVPPASYLAACFYSASTLTLGPQNFASGQAWADACWVPLVVGATIGLLISIRF